MIQDIPLLLRQLFDVAVAAAQPSQILPAHLPPRPAGRLVVLGAGKAAAEMARVTARHYGPPLEGLVVTRHGHTAQGAGAPHTDDTLIEVIEAGHPVPDAAGVDASARIIALAQGLGPDDLALVLISGGGSALLSLPAPGLSLSNKQFINDALLRSGAPIDEINCVRKHLSAIKGGRLGAAIAPAACLSLIISDVVGDDPSVIASGPTCGDQGTLADARAILEQYQIDPPDAVQTWLNDPMAETPTPADPALRLCENRIIARPAASLEAAAALARAQGWDVRILGDEIEGEAATVAAEQAALAQDMQQRGERVILLSGGEVTVNLGDSTGAGGPNSEFALALAIALDGAPGISALAGDTDGIDGNRDSAGAIITADSLGRGQQLGLEASQYLRHHDSYSYFRALGDLVITGPSLTNVNDFRAIVIEP